jgi:anti-sigma B factor antagonist
MNLAEIELIDRSGYVVARLHGEIDLANAAHLQDAIAAGMPNSTLGLILDLSDAQYMDSAGIRLIYQLRERLRSRGQVLRLVIPAQAPAQDALRLAGVSGHIDTAPSVEEALAAFGA